MRHASSDYERLGNLELTDRSSDQPQAGCPVNRQQLSKHIEIAMASDSRHVPILRGRIALIDVTERGRLRQEYSDRRAKRILSSNLTINFGYSFLHGGF